MREEHRAGPCPRGRKGGLGPGVAAADDDHIESGGEIHDERRRIRDEILRERAWLVVVVPRGTTVRGG
jgi:hypothetical protein